MADPRSPVDEEPENSVLGQKRRCANTRRLSNSTPTARLVALLTSGLFGTFALGLLVLVVAILTGDRGPPRDDVEASLAGRLFGGAVLLLLLPGTAAFILAYAIELGLRAVRDRLDDPGLIVRASAAAFDWIGRSFGPAALLAALLVPLGLGVAASEGEGIERVVRFVTRSGGEDARMAWAWSILPLLIWFHLVLHEFGHLAGARLAALHATALTAGPLRIEFDSLGRWHWGWNRSWLLLLAGLVEVEDLRSLSTRQQVLFVSAGPVATAIALAVFASVVWLVPTADGSAASGALVRFAGHGTWIGALVLLLNLTPLPRATDVDIGTDGRLLLDLWRRR